MPWESPGTTLGESLNLAIRSISSPTKNAIKTYGVSREYPLGESNPCCRTENPESWATRRRGPGHTCYHRPRGRIGITFGSFLGSPEIVNSGSYGKCPQLAS